MIKEIQNSDREILVVDDDSDNRRFLERVLEAEGYRVVLAATGEEGLRFLESNNPHLVLLDVDMPGIGGLETLRHLREKDNYVSVILVTAKTATNDIVKGLDLGADDYIRKPYNYEELAARVRAQLRIKDLNDELQAANKKLQRLVEIDDLTGLFNMRSLYSKLDLELERALRFGQCVSVIMMDLDHFKQVNDDHDHLFGSFVLAELGKIIRENIRRIDIGARYGGDEFLIVLTQTTEEGVKFFTERLRSKIAEHVFSKDEYELQLTSSLGYSYYDPSKSIETSARQMVKWADQALYMSKDSGRNCVTGIHVPASLSDEPEMIKIKLAK